MLLRLLASSVISVALLAVATAGMAGSPKRIAILPIVVHSYEAEDYLQAGLADMMASRLGRVPGVAVIRVSEPERATTDLPTAQAAGRDVAADYVLFGSFTHFGDGASLDVRCAAVGEDIGSPARSIFVQSGTLGEIIPRLDALADKVARHVVAGGGDATPDVAASPPAAAASGELEILRERVDALEDRVFGVEVIETEEVDLGTGEASSLEGDPALQSDLR